MQNLTSSGSYSDMDMLEICNSGMWPSETVPPLCSPCDPAKGPCHSKCPDGSACPWSGVCPHADGTVESTEYGWMRSDAGTGAKPRHPLQSWAEYRSQFSTFAILTSPLILGNVSALPHHLLVSDMPCDVMSYVELGLVVCARRIRAT